eukprot:1175948-Prorocentrum_minimum.AAC.2
MDRLWTPCGPPVDPLWIPCGPPVDPLWTPCGPPVDPLWTPCGPPVDPLWTPCDPLPGSYSLLPTLLDPLPGSCAGDRRIGIGSTTEIEGCAVGKVTARQLEWADPEAACTPRGIFS